MLRGKKHTANQLPHHASRTTECSRENEIEVRARGRRVTMHVTPDACHVCIKLKGGAPHKDLTHTHEHDMA